VTPTPPRDAALVRRAKPWRGEKAHCRENTADTRRARRGAPQEKGQLDVDITVKDKKSWWSANAGTYVQQGNKGSVDAHVRMRNLLGHAEVYELQGSRDTAAGSEYALSVLYPRLAGTPLQAELRLTKDAESHVKTSSFTQSSQGVSAHLRRCGYPHASRAWLPHVLHCASCSGSACEH
jgi:hypothetical protein